MNEHVSDMELERFLRRRDRLSQEYAALETEGPSAELDARVLERARRALGERSPFWRANWPRITALAATVVLSFALVVRLAIDNEMPMRAAAPTATKIKADRVDAAAPSPPRSDLRIGSPSGGESAARAEFDADARSVAPAPLAPAAPAAPAAPHVAPGAPPVVLSAPPNPAISFESAAPQAISQSTPAATEESSQLDETRQRLERSEAAIAKRTAEPAQRELAEQEQAAAAPAEASADQPPQMQGRAQPTRPSSELRSVTVTGSRVGRTSMEVSPSQATIADVERDDAARDPQKWFEQIQRMRTDGRTEEADREMERLRAAHPDFEPAQQPEPTR